MSSQTFNRIGPWSITQDDAPSALSSSPCSNSPRRRAARTGVNLHARLATRYGQQRTRKPAGSRPARGNAAYSFAVATLNSAVNAARSRTGPSSASPRTESTVRYSGPSASRAKQSTLGTGTATTLSAPTTTDAAGTFRRSTASPSSSTRPCSKLRVACAPSAAKRNPTSTVERARNSGSRLTTATPRARCAACSARSATGLSACSEMIRHSYRRLSNTFCTTKGNQRNRGGHGYCPPGNRGGQP